MNIFGGRWFGSGSSNVANDANSLQAIIHKISSEATSYRLEGDGVLRHLFTLLSSVLQNPDDISFAKLPVNQPPLSSFFILPSVKNLLQTIGFRFSSTHIQVNVEEEGVLDELEGLTLLFPSLFFCLFFPPPPLL